MDVIFLLAKAKDTGGSFQAQRRRRAVFEDHRHDRGWPHEEPQRAEGAGAKKHWKTIGIFHFRHDEEEEG